MENPQSNTEELTSFLETIYGNLSGYSYVALKKPAASAHLVDSKPQWDQLFFQWPAQKSEMIHAIQANSDAREVYYSPALFDSPAGRREHFAATNVVWVEFDGTLPKSVGGFPEPSIRVRSSVEGHEHWYWVLDSPSTSSESVEAANRGLAYLLGADSSGWDINQVLRPLGTRNHKRAADVALLQPYAGHQVPLSAFDALPPPPVLLAPIELTDVPPVGDVIAAYKINSGLWELFRDGKEEGKRSEGLMALAYGLAETGMKDEEIFALLLNADGRWGKFAQRSDQTTRLLEIVTRVRIKHPFKDRHGAAPSELQSLGFVTVMNLEVQLEWVWEGFLQKSGVMLLSGSPGIGKTQLSLQAGAAFVLGKPLLGREIHHTQRVGFFSLEMNVVELKHFLQLQAKAYTPEELVRLEEDYRFFALGQSIYLNREEEQGNMERIIREENLEGIIVDSLGSSTSEDLSSEREARALMDWVDYVRNDLGVFVWFIHHNRKASGDNKKPNRLGDVFGSQYYTSKSSTVAMLWDGGNGGLQFIPLKVRMAKREDAFSVHRNEHLMFDRKLIGATSPIGVQATETEVPEEKKGGSLDLDFGSFGNG